MNSFLRLVGVRARARWQGGRTVSRTLTRRTPLTVEALEHRIVPSFTITDTPTDVVFLGDDANNTLLVRVATGRIEYSANGNDYVPLDNARPDTVTSFAVRCGDGNNTIDLHGIGTGLTTLAALGKGALLQGGNGNNRLMATDLGDTLIGGTGQDTLIGGGGDDTIDARHGHGDTIDGGDGRNSVYFNSTDNTPVNCQIWNPMTPAIDNQPQTVKVLVLNYDPLIPSQGNQHLWEAFNWGSPYQKAEDYKASLEKVSGGAIHFDVVEWRNLNEIPALTDGYRYGADEYYQARDAINHGVPLSDTIFGQHTNAQEDYGRAVVEQGVPAQVNAGQVDEVWFFGDHFFGIAESFMFGPGAFFINGPIYPSVPTDHPFVGLGFSYERGVGEMIHDNGHRTESTMNRVYGPWDLGHPMNNWELFSANVAQSNGIAGVGTVHYPANAVSDYDYGNPRIVQSFADDYLNYPNLTFPTQPVNATAWSKGSNPDYQTDYLEWYFDHVPRAAGVNPDGKQNNWWKYLYDFNDYDTHGQPLPLRVLKATAADIYNLGGTTETISVSYSSALPIDVSSLTDGNLQVTAPDGTVLPVTLVGESDATNGTRRVATYSVTAPSGTWGEADRGRYTVSVQAGQVRDVLGNTLAAQDLTTFQVRTAAAEALQADADTMLLLPFDGTTTGVGGQMITSGSGIAYSPGVVGQALDIGSGGYVRYAQAGNINGLQGTVEFWIQPTWNGTESRGHIFFTAGLGFNNGMQLAIDGANNLRFIQWDGSGVERGVGATGRNWVAGQWYHFAVTWDGTIGQMAMYVNGQLVGSATNGVRISSFSATTMAIGADFGNNTPANAAFDEFRISDRARASGEIAADYQTGLALTTLTPSTGSLTLTRGERRFVTVSAGGAGVSTDVTGSVQWSSDDPAVAVVTPDGQVQAVGAGSAILTATLDTLTTTITVTVNDPGLPTATLTSAPIVFGGRTETLTVTYASNTPLNTATLDRYDVRVAGPGGFSQFARLLSFQSGGDDTIVAMYQITAPYGVWNYPDNGVYDVQLVAWKVADSAGNFALPADLGQFTVDVPIPTALQLESSANPSVEGQEVTFTVTVLSPPGAGNPIGAVTLLEGEAILGTIALRDGIATFTLSDLAVGSHDLTAVFSGDDPFRDSTSAVLTQIVNPGNAPSGGSGHSPRIPTGALSDEVATLVTFALTRGKHRTTTIEAEDSASANML